MKNLNRGIALEKKNIQNLDITLKWKDIQSADINKLSVHCGQEKEDN
jgi:hypothetical protein